jgi:hypothetical protein
MCSAVLAVVAGSAWAPAPASAQGVGDIPYVDAVDAWADGESLRGLLPGSGEGTGTESAKPKQGAPRPKRPTARQLATLRFERTEAVTAKAYQAVMDLLEPGYDPAALVAEFDRLKALVHKGMRQHKDPWSPNNIGDVVAYMLVSCYAAFYSRTSLPDRGVLAVRRSAREDLASDRRIRRLSDARMQEAAEMLELRTIIRISDLNVARMQGDAALEQAAEAELRSFVREVLGVDFKKVKLTRQGLVRR